MIPLIGIAVLWLHFLGDFIFQTDTMAINKSKSNKWLCAHGLTYGIPLLCIGWKYALVNVIAHMGVDFITSRINARLWAAEKRHWFFVGIGADQAIHMTFLFLTLP